MFLQHSRLSHTFVNCGVKSCIKFGLERKNLSRTNVPAYRGKNVFQQSDQNVVVDLDDEEEGPVHLEHDVRLQVGKAGAVFTKLYFL